MTTSGIFEGALAGAVGGVWAAVVTYLGAAWAALPFPPFVLFDWEARVLPGFILDATVNASIWLVGALHLGPTAAAAKNIEHALAVVQFLVLGAVLGILVSLWSRRRTASATGPGAVLGGLLWLGFTAMGAARAGGAPAAWSLAWLAVVFLGWGTFMGAWFRPAAPGDEPEAGTGAPSRRRFLAWTGLAGVAAGAAVLASGTIRRLFAGPPPAADTAAGAGAAAGDTAPMLPTSGPAASPSRAALAARVPPAPGTRPEVTPTASFYRIDIDSSPPTVDGTTWRLELSGLVARPRKVSLADLRAMPAITQAITLSCISNPVGGDLISTGFVTGVPFSEVVALAGPAAGVTALNMKCADGFHESMALQTAMDERTLLVYDLNGEALPAEHGFPARVYIPDRYGMKQPKWITSIDFAREAVPGFWVKRGWSREALVRTTSVVDPPPEGETLSAAGTVTVGGIAYSGDRGISKVEVQVDGGPWEAAELRDPPLSPLTWVQWRFTAKLEPGSHTFAVRATDGAGHLQAAEVQDSYPAGATGIFSRSVQLAQRSARLVTRRPSGGSRRV